MTSLSSTFYKSSCIIYIEKLDLHVFLFLHYLCWFVCVRCSGVPGEAYDSVCASTGCCCTGVGSGNSRTCAVHLHLDWPNHNWHGLSWVWPSDGSTTCWQSKGTDRKSKSAINATVILADLCKLLPFIYINLYVTSVYFKESILLILCCGASNNAAILIIHALVHATIKENVNHKTISA